MAAFCSLTEFSHSGTSRKVKPTLKTDTEKNVRSPSEVAKEFVKCLIY